MADETTHPRPDQAEEPADDVGASNVDLDDAHHGGAPASPAEPEAGHEPDHGHHDDHGHDDHGDHPVESAGWVLGPVAVGVIIAIIVLLVVGIESGASPS